MKALLRRVDAVLVHSGAAGASWPASWRPRPRAVRGAAAAPPDAPRGARLASPARRACTTGCCSSAWSGRTRGWTCCSARCPTGVSLTGGGGVLGRPGRDGGADRRARAGRPGGAAAGLRRRGGRAGAVRGRRRAGPALPDARRPASNVWLGHEHGVPVIATRVGHARRPRHRRRGRAAGRARLGGGAARGRWPRFYRPGEPERLRAGSSRRPRALLGLLLGTTSQPLSAAGVRIEEAAVPSVEPSRARYDARLCGSCGEARRSVRSWSATAAGPHPLRHARHRRPPNPAGERSGAA